MGNCGSTTGKKNINANANKINTTVNQQSNANVVQNIENKAEAQIENKKREQSKNIKSEVNKEIKEQQKDEKVIEKPKHDLQGKPENKEEVKKEPQIMEGKIESNMVPTVLHEKIIKEAVCSFKNFNKKGQKYDNFTNAFVKELNHSAKQVKKYFKDQEIYTSSEPYTDRLFPPSNESIFGLEPDGSPIDKDVERREEAEKDFQIDPDDIVWLRPADVFGPDFAMFEDKIEFDDVRQGSIGNCYFMASISALTENPQIIAEIFRHHDVNSNGYYEICLKIDGLWNVVILDDFIPCSKRSKRPIFANPKGNELWAILLEKAWAKINGGYINTVAGMASEVIECLTNFAYEYNSIGNLDESGGNDEKEALWDRIVVASNNDYIMTTALPPREGASKIGLVVGHEYTLIEGKQETIDGNDIRLLKIRNPWGSMRYTGEWCQNDPNWTEEMKEKFGFQNTYDGEGEFFIGWENFLYFFADVDICQIEERVCMKQKVISYEETKKPNLYQIKLFDKSKVTITLYKPYYRFVRELPTDWTITQQLLMAKLEDDDKEKLEFTDFVGSIEGQNDCTITKILEPGLYYFYCNVNYNSAKDRFSQPLHESILEKLQNTLSVYSTEFFGFNQVNEQDMALFYKMILSYSRKQQIEDKGGIKLLVQSNFFKSEFYFLYLNNYATNKTLKFSFDFSSMQGLYPITPLAEDDKCTFVLKPGQENVVVLSCLDMYDAHGLGYGLGYKQINQDEGSNLMPIMNPIPEFNLKSRNIINYDWIYKKGDVDYKNILKKIDQSDAAFAFFKYKYPKEVEDIQLVPKLEGHDEMKLEVQDKVDFGDGDWYLGEWLNVDGSLNMFGRGYAHLSGNTFIGQFQNHAFTGTGKMILSNGDIISGNFVKFNPRGKCNYTHNDGKVESRTYEEA